MGHTPRRASIHAPSARAGAAGVWRGHCGSSGRTRSSGFFLESDTAVRGSAAGFSLGSPFSRQTHAAAHSRRVST